MIDLLPYCQTDNQRETIQAVIDHGGIRPAARALGRGHPGIVNLVKRVKARAARQGHSPDHNMTHTVPDGYHVKGTSTYFDEDGNPRGQWVKSNIDAERQRELMQEAAEAFYEDMPKLKIPKPPKKYGKDVIPWFQIGDAHIGMLAHEAETGQNFDLKIAERELCAAMSILIDESPSYERCVIHDLGDASHYENFAGVTDASGHLLDYDGRYPKMIRTYSRVMRTIIEKALGKFKYVDVIINQGNHSRTNDIWMAELLQVAYGHSRRVHVLDNSNVFIPYRMGNTFVMTHHSDKCKPKDLAHVMATDFHQDWGESQYRYIDIGHIHHSMVVKEHPGVTVESWNQLAAPDKYAHDGGWRSRQCLTRVDRSKTYGEIGRRTLSVDEVRDIIIARDGFQEGTPGERREVYTVS